MASFVQSDEASAAADGVAKLAIDEGDKGAGGASTELLDEKKGVKHSGKLDENKLFRMIAGTRAQAREDREKKKTRDGHCFKFWDTQPVRRLPLRRLVSFAPTQNAEKKNSFFASLVRASPPPVQAGSET